MANEYVVTDRTTAQKYAISVIDEQISYDTTVNAASGEPIFEDDVNAGTYWKLFISDAQMAIESIGTIQDDTVSLLDATTNRTYKIVVRDGQLAIEEVVSSSGKYRVVKSFSVNRIVRFMQTKNLVDNHTNILVVK